jgi:hypothetical protein
VILAFQLPKPSANKMNLDTKWLDYFEIVAEFDDDGNVDFVKFSNSALVASVAAPIAAVDADAVELDVIVLYSELEMRLFDWIALHGLWSMELIHIHVWLK